MEPRFPFLAIEVAAADADDVGYALMELGAAGVELQERGERVRVVASFASLEAARSARNELDASLAQAMEVGELVGDAWRDAYKAHFKPFALTRSIVVVPSWERYEPKPGEVILQMDPGRAFGTGLHATTSLVAQALEARRERVAGARVLDVGTGSGILAIAALLLGAREAMAIDNDPEVLDVARENLARNAAATGAARAQVDGTDVRDVAGRFEVVVANIRAGTLIDMADALLARTGGLLIVSGVLAAERDDVAQAFEAVGMRVEETLRRDEGADAWVAMVLVP